MDISEFISENNTSVEDFFKVRTETDKIILKFREWHDFREMPQKDLEVADNESWEMFAEIVKMIKKFNKKYSATN